jgi:hypothetical protein
MNRPCILSLSIAGLLMAGCMKPTSITLHPTSAMVRIGGADGTAIPPQADAYRLDMVRNEREGFQFAVMPEHATHERLDSVDIRARQRDAPTAALYQVLPVNHVAPPTTGQFVVPPRRLGQTPDVLTPASGHAEAEAVKVEPGKAPLTYYLEFQTTAQTRPAKYLYYVSVLAGKGPNVVLQVRLTVHKPVLPDRLPFRTATTWNWSLEDYFGRPLRLEEKRAFWDFFLDQRLSPTAFFAKEPSPSPAEAVSLKDRGLSVMNLTFVGGKRPRPLSTAVKQKLGRQLKQWRQELQAAGLIDIAVILLADEPEAAAAPVCRENAKWLKEQFPEGRIWVATRPVPEWDFADIFDPVTAYSTDLYKAHSHTDEALRWWRRQHTGGHAASGTPRRAANAGEYWWFHSVEPYAPYPNIRLDNLPIEARVAGWQSALYGVDGYEYFWMTDWSANKDTRDVPWPRRAAQWKTGMSGAGTLCYPDERGLPMPSLRLVNLRDGLEDWALVEMLAARSDAAGRRQLVGKVTTGLDRYTTDPQVVLRAKAGLIAALEDR